MYFFTRNNFIPSVCIELSKHVPNQSTLQLILAMVLLYPSVLVWEQTGISFFFFSFFHPRWSSRRENRQNTNRRRTRIRNAGWTRIPTCKWDSSRREPIVAVPLEKLLLEKIRATGSKENPVRRSTDRFSWEKETMRHTVTVEGKRNATRRESLKRTGEKRTKHVSLGLGQFHLENRRRRRRAKRNQRSSNYPGTKTRHGHWNANEIFSASRMDPRWELLATRYYGTRWITLASKLSTER